MRFPRSFVHRLGILFLLAVACRFTPAQSPGKPVALPSKYIEDRFYVVPEMLDGTKLNFFTDTGGANFIFDEDADRLHLQRITVKAANGKDFEMVPMPAFKATASIPEPLGSDGKLYIGPNNSRTPTHQDWTGMLGQNWFAGRVWTFDYPGKKLFLRASDNLPKHKPSQEISLAFKTDKQGKRELNYPRITIIIDGTPLDVLFDTGASANLSEATVAALKDNRAAYRATSFIVTSVFEKWRKLHPDWRVIEKSDVTGSEALIEVPKVTVAGQIVGPVWFTRKPDFNFHIYMNSVMDKPIDGALGGNALRFFKITVDYPNAIAVFER